MTNWTSILRGICSPKPGRADLHRAMGRRDQPLLVERVERALELPEGTLVPCLSVLGGLPGPRYGVAVDVAAWSGAKQTRASPSLQAHHML
jgi:hypothetical protein